MGQLQPPGFFEVGYGRVLLPKPDKGRALVMPLSFDLSGVNSSSNGAQRRTSASVLTPVTPVFLQPLELKFSKQNVSQQQQFTFSLAPPASTFKTTFMNALDIKAEVDQCQEVDRSDDPENDQYTVAPEKSLCIAVFCRHETGRRHPKSVLGDFGHLERSSAWIHFYREGLLSSSIPGCGICWNDPIQSQTASLRQPVERPALRFCVPPSTTLRHRRKQWAYWTRLLDYFGIYFAIAVGGNLRHCDCHSRIREH